MTFLNEYLTLIPRVSKTDVVEILLISIAIYQVMKWIQSTKAWMLFKGILVLFGFIIVAELFGMTTISWLVEKSLNVLIIALVVVFQPELRKALEQLGQQNIFTNIISFGESKNEGFTEKTVAELVKATFELGKTKTGALIVIEKSLSLKEYERTGIEVDALVTSQLLINIFEHNTPLHDGAVIIRGNRIISATCYLPLSDSLNISKELGTRHRAAIGISEVTDSVTIVVSEETGAVSVAMNAGLIRDLNSDKLREILVTLQNQEEQPKRFMIWKGRLKNDKKVDE